MPESVALRGRPSPPARRPRRPVQERFAAMAATNDPNSIVELLRCVCVCVCVCVCAI